MLKDGSLIPELRTKPGAKMGLEELIVQAVEQGVKKALEGLEMAQNGKSDDDCLLTTSQAAKLLSCSGEYVRSLQDRGVLNLCFLPGSNHRRVLKSEVLELIEKSIVKRVGKR